ncbi:hypothetical protein EI94DRAFT_197341 [Lactarius quietus]|nr:hypothetical protein EI94DRAFT_197341 [Lactarius quietus]
MESNWKQEVKWAQPLPPPLEIVTIEEVVRLSRPLLRRNNVLKTPALRPPPSRPRAVLICGTRRGRSSDAPSNAFDGSGTCARFFFPLRLFVLLDNLRFAMIDGGGGNIGGEGTSCVSPIGVGSTHSSLSTSAESDDVVREKSTSTAVAFCDIGGAGRIRDV